MNISNSSEILTHENKISTKDIIASMFEKDADGVAIHKSTAALRQENFEGLFKLAEACVARFLNYVGANESLAPTIASDLIELRQDWRAADYVNCFKFIRQRKDIPELKIYGQLTPDKLMEMVCIYEEHRAMELEQYHAARKGEISQELKKLDAEGIKQMKTVQDKLMNRIASNSDKDLVIKDLGMGKEFDNKVLEREKTGKNVNYPNVTPDENWFKKK